jgi:hypothetical protein
MAKLGLFARIWQCGFSLAMPAAVITLYFLVWLLPRMLQVRYQIPAPYLRGTLLVTILIGFVCLFDHSRSWYQMKGQSVGQGGDRIVAFGPNIDSTEAETVALDWVDKHVPPDGTMAVLPEGITLNYLSRRVNPTPCLFWDPGVFPVFGEANMIARFEASAPDYIVIVEQSSTEFGFRYFGDPGFGDTLMKWVRQNYKVAVIIGNEPLKDGRFGIEILKHV